jgi:hypothetical protein
MFAQETPSLPQAKKILKQMSDFLAAAESFRFHADTTEDELLESGLKLQLSTDVDFAVRRPGRLWVHVDDGHVTKRFWYDGRSITLLTNPANLYASTPSPPGIDEVLDGVMDKYNLTLPLADFVYSNAYDVMSEHIKSGLYAGIHLVRGVPAHHLAFSQDNIDWQIWIEDGDQPVSLKLVITYKDDPAAPQFEAHLSGWDFAPHLPDETFVFDPPDGYKVVPAPVGVTVDKLPENNVQVTVGSATYYYYGGAFYQPLSGKYAVVAAPQGAVVSSLPDGTDTVVKNENTYFKYGDTYYQATSSSGDVVYKVVVVPA